MTAYSVNRQVKKTSPVSKDCLIATAIDQAFVEPACVLLASIEANGRVPDADLVVYGMGLSECDRRHLTESCGRMANKLSIVDLSVAFGRLKNLPVSLTVPSVVAYARILVPDSLPRSASRLLYLDSDIVVTDDLRPLFETQLGGTVLAALPDPLPPWVDLSFRSEILKLPDPEFYFNSGVLLIDVEAWRRENVTERAFEFSKNLTPGVKLLYPDQDVLNAILRGRWHPLERKWNYFKVTEEAGLQQFRSEAAIVHFASGKKPWVRGSNHPAKQIYLDHRRLTPFAHKPLKSPARHRIGQFVRSPLSTIKNLSSRWIAS